MTGAGGHQLQSDNLAVGSAHSQVPPAAANVPSNNAECAEIRKGGWLCSFDRLYILDRSQDYFGRTAVAWELSYLPR